MSAREYVARGVYSVRYISAHTVQLHRRQVRRVAAELEDTRANTRHDVHELTSWIERVRSGTCSKKPGRRPRRWIGKWIWEGRNARNGIDREALLDVHNFPRHEKVLAGWIDSHCGRILRTARVTAGDGRQNPSRAVDRVARDVRRLSVARAEVGDICEFPIRSDGYACRRAASGERAT